MYIFQKSNNMNTTVTIVMVKKQNITVPQGPLMHPSIKSFPSHNLTFYTNHYYQQAIITHNDQKLK